LKLFHLISCLKQLDNPQNYLPTHANQNKAPHRSPAAFHHIKIHRRFSTFPFSVPEVFAFVVFICCWIAETPLTVMTAMKPAVVSALIVAAVTWWSRGNEIWFDPIIVEMKAPKVSSWKFIGF
jgi:hypothetical protein